MQITRHNAASVLLFYAAWHGQFSEPHRDMLRIDSNSIMEVKKCGKRVRFKNDRPYLVRSECRCYQIDDDR